MGEFPTYVPVGLTEYNSCHGMTSVDVIFFAEALDSLRLEDCSLKSLHRAKTTEHLPFFAHFSRCIDKCKVKIFDPLEQSDRGSSQVRHQVWISAPVAIN